MGGSLGGSSGVDRMLPLALFISKISSGSTVGGLGGRSGLVVELLVIGVETGR